MLKLKAMQKEYEEMTLGASATQRQKEQLQAAKMTQQQLGSRYGKFGGRPSQEHMKGLAGGLIK